MLQPRERSLILLFLISDLLILNLSISIIGTIKYVEFWKIKDTVYLLNFSWFITYLPFINEKLFKKNNLYQRFVSQSKQNGIYIAIASTLIVILNLDDLSRTMFLGSSLLFFTFKFIVSYFHTFLVRNRKKGQYYSTILIIGYDDSAIKVFNFYKSNPDQGIVIGFLSDRKTNNSDYKIIGKISDFNRIVENEYLNEIIITLQLANTKKIKRIIDIAEKYGIRPRVIPNYHTMFKRSAEIENLEKIPIINIREVPPERYANRFWKRAFDIAFASIALFLTSPLLLFVAIAIKIESNGPVFYKPIRWGRRGRLFSVYKFRSMKENDDPMNGSKATKINDSRITKIGKLIRKTNLDELPQFINVLKNEMSVVGPRPHRTKLNKDFQEKVSTYMVRHYIKPGITGWAQVNGWRGPTETKIQYKGRALHDLWYIENWSFCLDLYIIYLTVFGKKVRKNAF